MSDDPPTDISDRPLLAGIAIFLVAAVVWTVSSLLFEGNIDVVRAVGFALVFAVVYVGITVLRDRRSR